MDIAGASRLPAGEVPRSAAAALVAAVLLAIGSSIRGDLQFLIGLPFTLASFAVASRAMWLVGRPGRTASIPRAAFWLSVMAAVGLVTPVTHAATWWEVARRTDSFLGIVAVGVLAGGGARARRLAIGAVIGGAVVLHLATPLAMPDPNIDVWTWTQFCARALLHGVHPYTVVAPDVHRGAFDYGYTSTVYPYMPLTLLVYAPVVALLGDFRFLLAASFAATLALLWAAGRRLQVSERFVDAALLTVALYPRGLSMTAYGWTESLLAAVAALFVFLAVRAPQGTPAAIAFFLLPALKQYIVAPVALFVVMPPRPRIRAVLAGMVVGASTVLPFLIWQWRPTVAGMVFQMRHLAQPRLDSDSLVALLGLLTGRYPSRWLSPLLQCAVAGIAYLRLRTAGLGGLLLASALSLFVTFLAGWQAFINYYYFVTALLLLAAIVLAKGSQPDDRLAPARVDV